MKANIRIPYLDGLKAFCAIFVVILHYVMEFVVNSGFVGWNSGIEDANKISYFWENAPISFIVNGSFFLILFFTIISFLPAWHFFNRQDVGWIKKQAIIRYFRFLPYTLIFTLISYAIYVNGGYFNEEVATLLNLSWSAALMQGDFSWSDAFISGLFRAFWKGDGGYISVLWCMHIIFLGSYIGYALLLFFASSKKHMYIYFTILVASYFALPWAMPFVGGIMVASLAHRELKNPSSAKVRAVVGWSLFIGGLSLGLTLDGLTINYKLQDIFKVISALSILLSVFYLDCLQKVFQNKYLVSCGNYIFAIIMVHCIIMLSVSSWMFIELHNLYGYNIALFLTFFAAIFLNTAGVFFSAKILDPICNKLSNFAYNFLK